MKNNWQTKKIKDLDILFFKGISPKEKTIDGDTALIPSGAVFPEGIKVEKTYKFFFKDCDVKDRYLENNDILFNCGGVGTLGRSALFNNNLFKIKAVPDSFILVIRSKETNILNKYLYYYLQTKTIKNEIEKNTKGTTGITSIRTGDIVNFLIPFPIINDQQCIVKILDQANELIQKRKQAIGLLDEYLKSVFLEMFGDPVVNPKKWPLLRGRDYSELLTVGVVVKPASYYVSEGIIALRSLNIKPNKLDLSDIVHFSKESHQGPLVKSILRKNDVVVVRTGLTGTAAVIPQELDGINCIDLIIVRPKVQVLNPYYYSYFLNSDRGKILVASKEVGGIQKHFNIGAIKEISLPVPPIKLQYEFAEIVRKTEQLKQKMLSQSEELENNFQSLMQKAFKGELIK